MEKIHYKNFKTAALDVKASLDGLKAIRIAENYERRMGCDQPTNYSKLKAEFKANLDSLQYTGFYIGSTTWFFKSVGLMGKTVTFQSREGKLQRERVA